MAEKKKVLIVDDIIINRVILKKMLKDEYELMEASNGEEALALMHQYGLGISLVLLDLVMPVMDGFEVLAKVREDSELASIPIIVITGDDDESNEAKCLMCGATDFVKKPFNVEVVRNRVGSMIRLRENSVLLNQIKNDFLTGIYTREYFCEKVKNILQANPQKQYDIVCSDITNFKLINERYGRKIGDELLIRMAKSAKAFAERNAMAAGRLASNTFAVLVEHKDEYTAEEFQANTEEITKDFPVKSIVIKYGIYAIEDRDMPVSGMTDRAELALGSVKHKYGTDFGYYDDSIRLKLLEEEKIAEQMESALEKKQFVVYMQPKHDVKSGGVAGAEALVRWQHPTMGLVPPGVFIPIFERNGFITKVDAYVWEETCRLLRKWLDAGLAVVPVSVNISRLDFMTLPLTEYFVNLIAKYKLPPDLLHLEVTESAYMDNPKEMVKIVEVLRQEGFKIEMDDFGSGYSSLNLLSDLPIDMLKVDMQFVRKHKNSVNNQGILSFILSLSKWLGLPTIVEGVETMEELHLLVSMGCDFVQGYYFAKPMPAKDFIEYVQKHKADKAESAAEASELIYSDTNYRKLQKDYTVLLVEDVIISMEMLEDILSPYFKILKAQDGNKALEILDEHYEEISVVLMDLMMPVMDGFQLIEHMKKDERLKDIPVVVTSEAGRNSEIRSLKLGAENFVPKPYNKDILLHHLDSAIDRYELKKLRKHISDGTKNIH